MGLLDTFFGNPDQTHAMGLLGARMMSGNTAQGFADASAHMAGAPERQRAAALAQMQMQNMQAEVQARQLKAQQEQEAIARARAIQEAVPGLYGQPGMPGAGAAPQGGQPGAASMPQAPGGFDVQAALRLGLTPKQIEEYAALQNIGKPKATRQMEVDDGKGGKRIALVDDFGREVAGFAGYTAPVQVNQGDRVAFVRPEAGVHLPVNMSPEARASNALGWANHGLTKRGQDLTDARARETNGAGKAPPGYRFKADGSMEAIPGGPADLKAGAEGQKRTTDAKDVLGLLDEVDALLPKATGSLAGAGVDQAARFVGLSTKGAEATAQLKAIQGALIGKMPKMSGPQSDRDVQLYREMAGQVADPTIPVASRQAAANMIRALNEKYAGMEPGSSKAEVPKANVVDALPKTAPKGSRARDTATGKVLVFNGMSWVPEK